MVALSRYSEAAVYVASIIIHTTGIVLLFQYLFLRRTCNQCHGTILCNNQRDVTDPEQYTSMLQRTLTDNSHTSEKVKRKRMRPHTTYGDGGEYLQYHRRRSSSSWDSMPSSSVEKPYQTASGRRFPPRSPGVESRPKSAERPRSQDLRRSRSFGERKLASLGRSDSGKAPMRDSTDEDVSRPSRALRRTRSGSIFREELDECEPGSSSVSFDKKNKTGQPSPSRLRFASTEDKPLRSPPFMEEIQHTSLRPILLPPLNDIYRPRSASGYQSEAEEVYRRPSSSRNASDNSTALTSTPMTHSTSQPLAQQTTRPSSSESSDFAFPFRPRPQSIEYEEDYSDWKPGYATSPAGEASSPREVIATPAWPLALEALVEPDPPFIAEERHYCIITPTESRLSTITEEGTVRDSVVITPQNILISDHFPHKADPGSSGFNLPEDSNSMGATRDENGTARSIKRLSTSSQESAASDDTVQRA